jgi:nitroreductase
VDLYEALLQRRTVHAYRPEPVAPAALDRVLCAAHHAPCHKLTWPWRFTRVGPVTRARITAIGVALKDAKHGLTDEQRGMVAAKLDNPGALVVVTQRRCPDVARAREDYAAVACAIQNMQLAAHGEGLGAKWSTGALTRDPRTCAALGIDVDQEEVVGFVWLGHPARVPNIERPPWQEVVRDVP